jgi:hypothetical protein
MLRAADREPVHTENLVRAGMSSEIISNHRNGGVTLRSEERKGPVFRLLLGGCDRCVPSVHRRGAEAAVRRR